MRFSIQSITLSALFMLLTTALSAETKPPKNLFFKIDLDKNVTHFGYFETKNGELKATESKTLSGYNENDMAQLIKSELDSTLKDHKILLYIHGMWGNRKMILNRDIFNLEMDYGTANELVVHIIWEGQSPNVRVCQKNARDSNPYVTPILRGALNLENVSSTLMCHSMGNYLFFELMDGLQNTAQIFEKIFLMAPDVALPVFDEKMDILEEIGKTTRVYYNKKDLILFFSQIVNRDKRLGKRGATVNRDFIEITDCTKEKNRGFLGRMTHHSYFRTSPVVRESLKKQINF
jgi:hypothetical protein